MSNPLRLFRKYEYIFLVAFGIMLMFAFVVGPILSDYLDTRMRQGYSDNPVVVSWKGGELREIDMSHSRTAHLLTTKFLRDLVSRVEVTEGVTVNRKGEKVNLIKGRRYLALGRGRDENDQMVFQIVVGGELVNVPEASARLVFPRAQMITEAAGEEELVQRQILAEKARRAGVVIDDAAVIDYLDHLCDATPETRPDYAALLADSTNGRLDMKQFLNQMSTELLAQRMLIMSQGGLYAAAPDILFQCYNKLNRRVTAELLAVDVADFTPEVGEPSEQDVVAFYEAGKNRFPLPTSPDPGFKQRKKIAFGYMQGTFDDFLQREMERISPTITDEEIEKYYADNKDTEFKVPELPDAKSDAAAPSGAAAEQVPADTSEGAMTPSEETAAKETPAKETPAEAKPDAAAEAKPDAAPPDAKPAEDEPASKSPAESSTPQPPAKSPVGSSTEEPPPAKKEALQQHDLTPSAAMAPGEALLVSFQEPETAPAAAGTPAQSDAPAPSDAPTPGDAPAPDDAGSNPTPPTDPPASPPPTLEPPRTAPDPMETTRSESEKTESVPQPEAGADGQPESGVASAEPSVQKEPAAKPVQYKPLDDELRGKIREDLARTKAREPAQQNLEDAIEKARTQVGDYARQLSRSKVLEGREPPAPVNFEEVAKENNLVYGQTGLIDVLDVSVIRNSEPAESDPPDYEFLRATQTTWNAETGMTRRSIIDVAFPGELELYTPSRFVDGILPQGGFPIPPEKLYVYWRTEVVPEQIPELNDVRSQVVQAWKMEKALPLAQAQAEDMAERAGKAGQSLAEAFPEGADSVIRTTQFSWMTRGSLPAGGGGRPTLSPVNGIANNQPVNISGAGNDFMRSVFALDLGQVGTAVDEPRAFVYLVRIDSEDLTEEQRREAFFATGYSQEIGQLVQNDQATIIRDWFDGVEKEYQVTWKRDAIENLGRD